MAPLPSTRPSLPDTDSTPAMPAWRVQVLPSEAVPHPAAVLRPAKLSWAKTAALPGGVGDGVGAGVGVGVGVGLGVGGGVGVGVGLGVGVGVGVGVGDPKKALIGVAAASFEVSGARPHADSMVLSSE